MHPLFSDKPETWEQYLYRASTKVLYYLACALVKLTLKEQQTIGGFFSVSQTETSYVGWSFFISFRCFVVVVVVFHSRAVSQSCSKLRFLICFLVYRNNPETDELSC